MLYCDLDLNNVAAWRGMPLLLGVAPNVSRYQGFKGDLIFVAEAGVHGDPTWEGLGTSFFLLFFPPDGSKPQQIPLQATPTQQMNLVLAGQNVTLSVYFKPGGVA